MATKLMNFRVEEELALRIEREAKRVPYRNVSTYLREVIEAALPPPPKPKKAKAA